MLVYSNLIGSPSGDNGNLCTYAQLILTRDGLKKEGRHSAAPSLGEMHRRGRRCRHSKAVKRRVRCDRGHSHGKPSANSVAPLVALAIGRGSPQSFAPHPSSATLPPTGPGSSSK